MIVRPGLGIVPPPPTLPENRHFSDFLTAYREYTINHEATSKVHMWTGISIIAAALERKVWLDRGYYKTFPNLFMFIIGAPGLVKKSTTTAIGIDLLRELPTITMMAEKISASSLIESLSDARDEFHYKGRQIKQSAVFAYASELMVFMNEVGSGDVTDLLTTFYDCQPQDSEKPWVYKTRSHGEVSINGPCLNLLGCSTKAWLKRAIPPDQMEGGFASRVLFVIEDEMPDRFVAIPELIVDSNDFRRRLVEDLHAIHLMRGEMHFDREAHHFFVAWYEMYMNSLHGRRNNMKFAGYYGRKPAMVEKLAMISCAARGNGSLVITVQHVMQAVAWIEQLEVAMLTGFAGQGKNPHAEETLAVLAKIKHYNRIPYSLLSQNFFHDLGVDALEKVLAQLKLMGQIQLEVDGQTMYYSVAPNAPDLFEGLRPKPFDLSSLEGMLPLAPEQPPGESIEPALAAQSSSPSPTSPTG